METELSPSPVLPLQPCWLSCGVCSFTCHSGQGAQGLVGLIGRSARALASCEIQPSHRQQRDGSRDVPCSLPGSKEQRNLGPVQATCFSVQCVTPLSPPAPGPLQHVRCNSDTPQVTLGEATAGCVALRRDKDIYRVPWFP